MGPLSPVLSSYPPPAPSSFYALRNHCASKLPSYRLRDVSGILGSKEKETLLGPTASTKVMLSRDGSTTRRKSPVKGHIRTRSEKTTNSADLPAVPHNPRPLTYPHTSQQFSAVADAPKSARAKTNTATEDCVEAPPQKSPISTSTTGFWVATQTRSDNSPSTPSHTSPSITESTTSRPLIPPIRRFKSSRTSGDMEKDDNTLRALEGYGHGRADFRSASQRQDHEEQTSDDSDLFLNAAKEEGLAQQSGNLEANPPTRLDTRSRLLQRQPFSTNHDPLSFLRGSERDPTPMAEERKSIVGMVHASSGGEKAPASLNGQRHRYPGPTLRSTTSAVRVLSKHDMASELPTLNGRRSSITESSHFFRAPYRSSNPACPPRTYNSSPLVSHTMMDTQNTSEAMRATDSTESTVSTTAPSTVWDELDELKNRINRLELTGKMPSSGGVFSRSSNERPTTATTTITTMSLSPKRAQRNSASPDSVAMQSTSNAQPLLQSALANSKDQLSAEVYLALEATTADALAIAQMMGTPGQPGPLTTSQSTIGGAPAISDRQVRKKVESICRNLTDLCLALSETIPAEAPSAIPMPSRPRTRDISEPQNNNISIARRQPEMNQAILSPRALSRLEARRSSLLATTRTPSEVATPTQALTAGRHTSLYFRRGTDELIDRDETRFRGPSRARTEIGQLRNFQEHSSPSNLPVRRHNNSSSLGDSGVSPAPPASLNTRRFLDRNTPERDTASAVGRLAVDRGQKQSFFALARTGSLTKGNGREGSTVEKELNAS